MERQSISDPQLNWSALIEHVVRDQVTVELAQGANVLARISPVTKSITMAELNAALAAVPSLGDDAASFERDVLEIRKSLPQEKNAWD